MKLLTTISDSPQYIGFDNSTDNLICVYPKEKTEKQETAGYLLKEYDIHSGIKIHGNFTIETAWPKLFNRIWFDSQYYLDDQTYSGGPLIIRNRFSDHSDGDKGSWNSNNELPNGTTFICQIDRTDSPFPFLVFWSRKDIIVFDLAKKETIKIIPSKAAPDEIYYRVYLPQTLDRIVCEKGPLLGAIGVTPSLAFFASEVDLKNNNAQFTWTPPDTCRYESIGFLSSDIFMFMTSTFGRYTFTGENRLYLYSFSANKIIVNKRLTSLIAFNSCAFSLNNVAISDSGKYLAILYDKKISIYEL